MFISANAQKILKVLHLITTSFWMGGCFTLTVLLYASQFSQTGDELYGVLKSYKFVNIVVTVYLGAYGSFFTGLAYSLCTSRGFFRHKWIIIKWMLTMGMIYCGGFYLNPWSIALERMSFDMEIAALSDPDYLAFQSRLMTAQVVCLAVFLLAILLSVYKPWEQKETRAQQERKRKRGSGNH